MEDELDRAFAAEEEGRDADALALFEAAAARGSAEAMAELAMRIDDEDRATQLIERSADLGDPTGMWLRGIDAKLDGDVATASAWWTRAAAAGSAQAEFELGNLAWSANDEERAVELWQRAAEGGSAAALTGLAFVANRDGDQATARELWTEAAECGQPRAMFHLAHLDLAAGDKGSAQDWMARAAESGDPDAMLEYGGMALTAGQVDITVEWWMGASLAGNAAAPGNLLMLATHGRADAVEALRQVPGGDEELAKTAAAAADGAAPAMVATAVAALIDGDRARAELLLDAAARQGNEAARSLLSGGDQPAMPNGYFRRMAEHLLWS